MKIYKIYDPATGLYSKGGTYGCWTKNGKSWSMAGLKLHLSMLKSGDYSGSSGILEKYKTCEIHEFEAEPNVIDIIPYLEITK